MIFYFSGTGNSLYAAKKIAEACNDRLVSVASMVKEGKFKFNLEKNESVGFVFPVFAWAAPAMVREFAKKLKFKGKPGYVYAVATCGANIGNTMKDLDGCLAEAGVALNSAFSIVMPNNYCIYGKVDSKAVEAAKLHAAENTLRRICLVVNDREKGIFELEKGIWTWLGTSVVNPLFMKNAMKPEKFHALDSCNGCGICARVCNCSNIKVDQKPQWGNNCSQCLACLNYCPVQAVQYGNRTTGKERYVNPSIKINEIMQKE